MKVEQMMSSAVHTCRESDSLERAAQLMWDNDCGCVPVVGDGQELRGIVTDRDIAMAAYTQGVPLRDIPISRVMARSVQFVRPGEQISDAEAVMRSYRVRRLPVLDDDDRLVGIVSLNDLARAAREQSSARRPEITQNEIATTLATIGEHRADGQPIAARPR